MNESLLATTGIVIAYCALLGAYKRLILPRVTRRWITRTLEKIRAGDYVPPAKRSDGGISFDAGGFSVHRVRPSPSRLYSVAWSDVLRVTAYKRDHLIVDCICLAIDTTDGTTAEVNEEMEGWEALVAALPEYLPGSKQWADCFRDVAFPAFATNATVLFAREPSPSARAEEM
jgi:hypothetical protein